MIAGIKVTLGGEDRIVPPLNLRALIEMRDELQSLKVGSLDPASIDTVVSIVHRALLRNYPEVTVEWVQDVIDVANMVDVISAVLDVSGLRRKKQEAEKQGETAGA